LRSFTSHSWYVTVHGPCWESVAFHSRYVFKPSESSYLCELSDTNGGTVPSRQHTWYVGRRHIRSHISAVVSADGRWLTLTAERLPSWRWDPTPERHGDRRSPRRRRPGDGRLGAGALAGVETAAWRPPPAVGTGTPPTPTCDNRRRPSSTSTSSRRRRRPTSVDRRRRIDHDRDVSVSQRRWTRRASYRGVLSAAAAAAPTLRCRAPTSAAEAPHRPRCPETRQRLSVHRSSSRDAATCPSVTSYCRRATCDVDDGIAVRTTGAACARWTDRRWADWARCEPAPAAPSQTADPPGGPGSRRRCGRCWRRSTAASRRRIRRWPTTTCEPPAAWTTSLGASAAERRLPVRRVERWRPEWRRWAWRCRWRWRRLDAVRSTCGVLRSPSVWAAPLPADPPFQMTAWISYKVVTRKISSSQLTNEIW